MRNVYILFAFLLISGVFLSTASSVSASTTFSDVSAADEYSKEVSYISDLGIIKGYQVNGKNYFRPDKSITRFQAAKMLVIASGNKNTAGAAISFPDVAKGTEEYEYISKAVKLGYFKGNPDGTFKPSANLTRGQMSKVLASAFDISLTPNLTTPLMFADISLGDEYTPFINGLYYEGIIRGSQGKYSPASSLTRGQFSLMLARALDSKFSVPVVKANHTAMVKGKVKLPNAGDTLNVRSGPGDSYSINGQLRQGNSVTIVRDANKDWVEIRHAKRPAYIHKSFIEFLDVNSQPIGLATHFVKINTPSLNVRNAPNANATLMGAFKSNDIIEVHGETNGWYLVLYNDLPAYISKAYTVLYEEAKPVTPITNNTLTGKVTVNSLNMRSAPNATSPIVTKLSTGNKVTVQSIDGYWAKVKSGSHTGYVHKTYLKLINTTGHILKNRVIVVDAGHGGTDPGASRNGVLEKNIVLDVAKRVETKLKASGANVLMTRKNDSFPSLQDRVDFSRQNYAETFVSIHVNAFSNSTAKGAEVFYDTSMNANGVESRYLATDIQKKIVQYADMYYRGVFDREFYVIRNQDIPAVLVELGFLTHGPDFAKLTSSAYLDKYAQAIVDGIVAYYQAP